MKYAMRTLNFVPKSTGGPQEMGLNLQQSNENFICLFFAKDFVGLLCFHLTKYSTACKSH